MTKKMTDTKWCKCGCGLPVTRWGRAVYYSDIHRQRDFRARQNAHKWAYYAMNKFHYGDMAWYPQLYEEYYIAEQSRQCKRHADEIRGIVNDLYTIPDEDLPY